MGHDDDCETEDTEVAAVLSRYQVAISPDDARTRRAWEAIRARIDAGPPAVAGVEADAAADAEPRRAWMVWAGVAIAAAAMIALTLSIDLGAAMQPHSRAGGVENEAPYVGERSSVAGVANETEHRRRPARNDRVDGLAPADVEAAPPVDVEQPDPVEAAPLVPAAEPKRRAIREPTALPVEAPQEVDATIAAELALLRAAQQAIAAGNATQGLAKIQQHAKSFPKSMMTQERELARVRALCNLGRESSAQSVADRFRRKFRRSHLLAQLEKTCAGSRDPVSP